MPDLQMIGDVPPAAQGSYSDAGMWNGMPYYQNAGATYFIWWELPGAHYVLSVLLGFPTLSWWDGLWYADSVYTPQGNAEGNGRCVQYNVWETMIDFNFDSSATIFHRTWPLGGGKEVLRCSTLGTGTNIYIEKTV